MTFPAWFYSTWGIPLSWVRGGRRAAEQRGVGGRRLAQQGRGALQAPCSPWKWLRAGSRRRGPPGLVVGCTCGVGLCSAVLDVDPPLVPVTCPVQAQLPRHTGPLVWLCCGYAGVYNQLTTLGSSVTPIVCFWACVPCGPLPVVSPREVTQSLRLGRGRRGETAPE